MTSEPAETAEDSPEYAAHRRRRAVAEYMGTSPQVGAGLIPEERLLGWQEALESVTNDPQELLAAGWVHAELAFHYYFGQPGKQKLSREEVDVIDALFTKAHDALVRVETHESYQVSDLTRSQAGMAAASMQIWANLAQGRRTNVAKYLVKQTDCAAQLIKYADDKPSVEAAMWADTLTYIALRSMGREFQAVLPCPPRLASPFVDSYHRHSAFEVTPKEFVYVRVGSKGHPKFLHIPYELLGNEEYPGHTYGTLLAVMQTENDWQLAQLRRVKDMNSKRMLRASTHILKVTDRLEAHVVAARQGAPTEPQEEPDSPREWVRALHVGRNPYTVDAERTDAVISQLELDFMAETISVDDAIELGWLYAEVAFGRAIDPLAPVAGVRGDIDRAEEIFSHAMERADDENVLQLCEASLAHSAAWVQRIVLCNDQLLEDDIDYYKRMLIFTGQRASTRYADLPHDNPEAVELSALMQRITLCLLVMSESRDIVAVITPPRQRTPQGWDVSVWVCSHGNFNPGEYGRLRITQKEDVSSFSDGVVTVTTQQLGQAAKSAKQKKISFRLFQALTDEYWGAEPMPGTKPHERTTTIQKAWNAVEPRIAATEVV